MSKYDALTKVLRQAGVKPKVVLAVWAAIAACNEPGSLPDDVAGCLLRWKDRQARQAYARGENHQRARSAVAASELLATADTLAENHEEELQCFLFEQLPEITDRAAVEADEPPRSGL